jgi:hypothetical protein
VRSCTGTYPEQQQTCEREANGKLHKKAAPGNRELHRKKLSEHNKQGRVVASVRSKGQARLSRLRERFMGLCYLLASSEHRHPTLQRLSHAPAYSALEVYQLLNHVHHGDVCDMLLLLVLQKNP